MHNKSKKLGLLIRDFAQEFCKSKEPFMNGYCYHFAVMLSDMLGGEVWYNSIDNHFVCKVGDDLYDAKGIIQTNTSGYIRWSDYKEEDSLHFARIMRDCVYKCKDFQKIAEEK